MFCLICRIEALRKLVPNDPRANTATFLEEVSGVHAGLLCSSNQAMSV